MSLSNHERAALDKLRVNDKVASCGKPKDPDSIGPIGATYRDTLAQTVRIERQGLGWTDMLMGRTAISRIAVASIMLLFAVVARWDAVVVPVTAQTSHCANGIAVPDPANNPGLVSDCEALLAARDTLLERRHRTGRWIRRLRNGRGSAWAGRRSALRKLTYHGEI